MNDSSPRRLLTWQGLCMVLVAGFLAGCASSRNQAPVEDRTPSGRLTTARPAVPVPANEPAAPKAEPGTYIVKPGDTLMRISLDTGQSWRDIARWNNVENPNLIEVGQVLKVVAPVGDVAVAARPVTAPKVETKPLDAKAPASAASGSASSPPAVATAAVAASAVPKDADDDIQWAWPSAGSMLAPFDDAKSKGLVLGGKAGDPVYAAADGRVIYANSGLRGYGNLIIIKHNANYLTAYAHNQTLLVKEDQAVRRGQKIAEMGSSDAERVQLHFEVRRQGKPIDPAKVLPPR
jgi:lipoprotein NlpD